MASLDPSARMLGCAFPACVAPGTTALPDPARLPEVLLVLAAIRRRTVLRRAEPAQLRAEWVVRSPVMDFLDVVRARVLPGPRRASRIVLYSRSLYGYSDLGANRRRLRSWLAAIDATVGRFPR